MTTNRLIVKCPDEPVIYSIYKITLGEHVYIGHTKDLRDRATRHSSDTRRTVGRLFAELVCDMIVEHLEGAHTKQHAREVERRHIELAKTQHGHYLLNVQHARTKKK